MDSQLPAIHAVITQAISALSESDREHLLSSLTTIRAGPTAVEVSTVNDLTGRIHHIPPPDSENSAVSRHGLFDAVPPRTHRNHPLTSGYAHAARLRHDRCS